MAMVKVDETRLQKLLLWLSMTGDCGACPLEECTIGKTLSCRKSLEAWLTEKPIGYDVENDGKRGDQMTKSDIQKLSLIASNCGLLECHRNWLHEIIEHEKKFMWHDLTVNPEDLPPLIDNCVASYRVLVKN